MMVQVRMILRVMRTIDTSQIDGTASVNPADPARSVAAKELVARIMAEFHHFIGEFRCAGTERLVKAGVSMTNLHVLGLLARHGEMPMSRLADLLDVSLSNATGLVDRMEERGLVERIRVADDRRIVLVRLTESGTSTLEEVELIRHDLLERLLGRLDESQLNRLEACLSDIHGAVGGLGLGFESDAEIAAHTHGHASRHGPATTYPLAGEHHRPTTRPRTAGADVAHAGADEPAR